MRADAGAIRSTFSRGVSRWERSGNREAGGGSAAAGAGRARDGRECGGGCGQGAGCEKRAVDEQARGYAECARTQGDRSTFRGEYGCGAEEPTKSMRTRARVGQRGRERVRF